MFTAAEDVVALGTILGVWAHPDDEAYLLVEPAAGDTVEDNLNPVGRLYYMVYEIRP
jgi:hypothetical protein